MPRDTVEEYTRKDGNYVEHVRIRRTGDEKYPSRWDYALHYGTTDDDTLLRYDNAHERTKVTNDTRRMEPTESNSQG